MSGNNTVRLSDPFISVVIYLFFEYIVVDLLYLKFSELYFTPPDIVYAVLGFLLPVCAAILYLMLRKYPIPLTKYFVKNKSELQVALIGIFFCWLFNYLQKTYGGSIDQSYAGLSYLDQPYRFLVMSFVFLFFPILYQTYFLGFYFEILKNRMKMTPAVFLVLISVLTVYSTMFNGIFQIVFFSLFQLVFIAAYIKGGLGASILVHLFLNIYLYFSTN